MSSLLMQNAFPTYPIVIDTLVNFQLKVSCHSYRRIRKGTQLAIYDEFGAFQILSSKSLLNPKQEC